MEKKMPETPEMQDPEEEKTRVEAKRLAESQGLKWKDLPKEKRKEFKRQVKSKTAGRDKPQV
jgi:hypothetical protein